MATFENEIQLEARDGSVTIYDTTPGSNGSALTQIRDPQNPDTVNAVRGPDGLYDGFTGAGYMDMGSNAGDAIAFSLNAPEAGVYSFTFRYASPNARPMNLLLDGSQAGQVAFASTGSFSTWQETTLELNLHAGNNTIRLANVGANGPNLDRVVVTHESIPADTTADEGGDLDADPASPSSTVSGLGAVVFHLSGVDDDIVTYEYSTNGGSSYTQVSATTSGADKLVTLDLSSFASQSSASVVFRVTDDAGNRATTGPATVAIVPDATGFSETIQLEARDGSVTIYDTTPGSNGSALTQIRDPQNPDTVNAVRGPDGLYDGFTGAGYMDMGSNAGDAIAFSLNAPEAGVYSFTFRYASPNARPMNLLLDGSQAGQVAFASTGSFSTWQETTLELNLHAGNNTIRLANVGANGPNLDRVTVTEAEGPEPGPRNTIKINFQDGTTTDAAGYLVDNFAPFAARGNGYSYGWVTQASAIDADGTHATPIGSGFPASAILERSGSGTLPDDGTLPAAMLNVNFDSYDSRLTGAARFDGTGYPTRAAWELGVANGWYEVTVSVGDTGGPNDSQNRLYLEGSLAASWQSSSAYKTQLVTKVVNVTDGFLTLSAQNGTNTEMQYVEVRALPDLTPNDGRAAPQDYAKFINPVALSTDESVSIEAEGGTVPTGIDPTSDLVLGIDVVAGRGGASLASLGDGSIRLFETLTGTEVTYNANTTGGFDSLTVAPSHDLKPYTSYTLEIDGFRDIGSNSNPDAPAREFQKFSTTFTTGPAPAVPPSAVAFSDVVEIASNPAAGESYTSIEMSPDHQYIYVASLRGTITRWAVDDATGEIIDSTKEVFTPGGDFNTSAGRRGIIGLTFDPDHPNTLWISDNYPVPLSGDAHSPDFSGRISKVTLGAGGSLANATVTPYITGLPRSNHDHVTNSIEFRLNPDYVPGGSEPHHLLYVSQGSNSAMGYPDSAWGYRPERLLNATVLEVDPTRTPPAGGFDVTSEPLPADGTRFADNDTDLHNGAIPITSGTYAGQYLFFDSRGVASVHTGTSANSPLVKEFYDPFDSDSVVKIFAEGFRNAYDLVWHSNGYLYLPTNGSAAGGSVPDDPDTPVNEQMTGVGIQPDYLFRVTEGGYYGHPNPVTNHYILAGGNPTAGVDPNQVGSYPVGTQPEPDYNPADAYSLLNSRSPNGAIEYTSATFGDLLQHALIFTQYSAGDNLRAVLFDDSGHVTKDFILRDADGKIISYTDPLDIVEGSAGRIYMLTLNRATGQSQLVRLDPDIGHDALVADVDMHDYLTDLAAGDSLL